MYLVPRHLIRLSDDNAALVCRLWHQLTSALTEFVNNPAAIQGDLLIQLYNSFILDFESRLNQLSLVRICLIIALQYPSMSSVGPLNYGLRNIDHFYRR